MCLPSNIAKIFSEFQKEGIAAYLNNVGIAALEPKPQYGVTGSTTCLGKAQTIQ